MGEGMLSNIRKHDFGEPPATPREKKPRTYAESDDMEAGSCIVTGG